MELLDYHRTPLAHPLRLVLNEFKNDIRSTDHVRSALTSSMRELLWTSATDKILTCNGYGLVRWLARQLGDPKILDTISQQWDLLTETLGTAQSNIDKAIEYLKTNNEWLTQPFSPGATLGNVYGTILRRLGTTGQSPAVWSPMFHLTYTVERVLGWAKHRGLADEHISSDIAAEKALFLDYMSRELELKKKCITNIKRLVHADQVDDLFFDLLGLIFIGFTPSFNGMYYHHVESDVVPTWVRTHFRENVEIPFKMGTVGYLPNMRLRGNAARDSCCSVVLQRLFADLRGIMSLEDSVLGNRSWIGYPAFRAVGDARTPSFLGVLIVNFPVDCMFAGPKLPDNSSLAARLSAIHAKAVSSHRDQIANLFTDELNAVRNDVAQELTRAAKAAPLLTDANDWHELLSLIVPRGARGRKQKALFGFPAATAWQSEGKKNDARLVLRGVSLLDTALVPNFEPAPSRRAAVLPTWKCCAEARMERYCSEYFDKASSLEPEDLVFWDDKKCNPESKIGTLVKKVWKSVEDDKRAEVVGQHDTVERSHETLHKWGDEGASNRIVDLLVPLFCPSEGLFERCTRCPLQDLKQSQGGNGSPVLAAIMRINCFDSQGVAPNRSDVLSAIEETVRRRYKDLRAVVEPICLYRRIKQDGTPLGEILANDFEDAWFSMVAKLLMGRDNIEENFLRDAALSSFDTCMALVGDKKSSKEWGASAAEQRESMTAQPDLVVSNAIRVLVELRDELSRYIRADGTSLFAISIWCRRRRLRLADLPKSSVYDRDYPRKEGNCEKNSIDAITDPIENRVLARMLAMLPKDQAAKSVCLELHALPPEKPNVRGVAYLSSMLARLPNDSRKVPGFNYVHCKFLGGKVPKWATLFSDKADISCDLFQEPSQDQSIRPYLYAVWEENIVFENSDWICAHSDIGRILFSDAIEHEALPEDASNKSNVKSYAQHIDDPTLREEAVKLSARERSLIEGGLLGVREIVWCPITIPSGDTICELHCLSMFQDPGYDKKPRDLKRFWEDVTFSHTFGTYLQAIKKICQRSFPSSSAMATVARNLPSSSAIASSRAKPAIDSLIHAAVRSYQAGRRTESDAGITDEIAAEIMKAVTAVNELCCAAVFDNIENRSVQASICLVPSEAVISYLDAPILDLRDKKINITDQNPESLQKIIRCMRILHDKRGVFFVDLKGAVHGAWFPSFNLPVPYKGVAQLSYPLQVSCSKATDGIVYCLPGNSTVKVFAGTFQIAECSPRGWTARGLADFIVNVDRHVRLEVLGVRWPDFSQMLSSAIWASDNHIGCGFVFASEKDFKNAEQGIGRKKNSGGACQGYSLSEFGLREEVPVREYDPCLLAGLGSIDGNVLILPSGTIYKTGALLRPPSTHSIDTQRTTIWGMRHQSIAAFVDSTEASVALVVSSTGRITVMAPRAMRTDGGEDVVVAECPDSGIRKEGI